MTLPVWKKISIKRITVALVSAAAMSSASAFTLDEFISSANLGNSGERTELEAIQGATGKTLILDAKFDVSGGAVVADTVPGQWVIDVAPKEPGYFLLKFGTGNLGGDDTYFFRNIAELTKLVFADSQVGFLTGGCGANNCNIDRLSHYTLFNGQNDSGGGTGGEVPEPATAALLGLGLLGFAASRRRTVKKLS